MRLIHGVVLSTLLLSAGCVNHRAPQREITLATAQRFHAFIKDVGSRNGFECEMSGFPVWRTRGLEPSLGRLGEWIFYTPSDPDGEGKQDLSQVVLVIRLASPTSNGRKNVILTWEDYDVVVVERTAFKQEQGSVDSLIAELKELRGKANNTLESAFFGARGKVKNN